MYTSSTIALAALELFVHIDPAEIPEDFVATSAAIPSAVAIARVTAAQLPTDWRRYPAPGSLADVGSRWTREGKMAVLAVPSALVPRELNYLINPLHPAFKQIHIGKPEPFRFDPRMFKQ